MNVHRCDVARIVPITDVIAEYYEPWDIKVLAQRILFKALLWLSRLNAKVLADIETAFGVLHHHGFFDDSWWESTDGPSWLWWLVAVLPLRSQIKVCCPCVFIIHLDIKIRVNSEY